MNDNGNFGMISSKMPHSHSTPAGVDGGSRTPPTTPRKAGKMLAVRVQMLDDTVTMFQVQAKALGRVLFDQVCKQLHLLEADYFGLEYQEPNGPKYWLDLEKPVCRQVGLSLVDPLLRFCVKFYTPDPGQLEEEFTRYLFCLQIKRDLSHGLLQCNDNTAALMASYIVQAECGDYVIEDYPDPTYLSTYKFIPHQDHDLERRIMENHKKHAGQSPAEADLNLLETARRCELYGMKMHPAKDHEGVPLNLAVAHMGIIVFQNYTKINTFSWAKIRKISFKRKRFLIKLHPEGYGYYKDTVEFFFDGRNECKNFWKKCVENHGFFRCSIVKRVLRQKTRVLSRGSSFRYSGKTQKQIVEFVRDNYVKRQTFQRSNSFRQTSGGRAMQGTEGGGYRGATSSSSLMGSSSISAHPLLPLGDPALGTPALSLSCGSMTLDSPTTVTSVSMGGTSHRREDTATSYRTLTSIDVHSPATPNQSHHQSNRHTMAAQHHQHQQQQQHQQQRITSSTGRISPSNSSPPEFPPPRPQPRHPWQRSSSCRDLYASSFEDSGRARPNPEEFGLDIPQLPSQGELDNPITRYDETNRSYSAASSKLPSLDHDSVPEKIYSSSYPGTSSLSTESGHEESGPGADLSHDDLSHDSYELLEREQEFEYPESISSPPDDAISDQSDEGIEQEMFQMDSETDSFVKHRSIKSTDKQLFKSVLADLKTAKAKSIDRHSPSANSELSSNTNRMEARIRRSSTQIERKFENRNVSSLDQIGYKPPLPNQESFRKDPVILQVHKQKMTVLNEIKNFKPKYKITHVDSEVLRDEGIMRPKSRIDDDMSPDLNRVISEQFIPKTVRAKSIASLDDHSHRILTETGSLGRTHRDKKADRMTIKERKTLEREERKRSDRDYLRETKKFEKNDSKDRRPIGRLESRERSYEKLDSNERNYKKEYREPRVKSVEHLDRSPKERYSSRHHDSRRDSRRSPKTHEYERHTLERFDSGNKSPFARYSPKELRDKSYERLEFQERPTFDFDPKAIERLSSLEYTEKLHEKKKERRLSERRNSNRSEPRERKSSERFDFKEKRRGSFDALEKSKKNRSNELQDDIPKERDDWRSLERARKEEERREHERQAKIITDTMIEVSNEIESIKKNNSGFSEYNPKVIDGVVLGFDDSILPGHIAIERTKSDPNPGRPRIGSNSKRHMLMHQKSIDLTPADSGDEDVFSEVKKIIPEIPYTLHKRHVINGTASDEKSESDSGKNLKISKSMDLVKAPLKQVTDVSLLDLTQLPPTPTPLVKLSTEKPKSILISPDKTKSPKLLSPKLSPSKSKVIRISDKNSQPGNLKTSPPLTPPKSLLLEKFKTEVSGVVKASSFEKKVKKLSPIEPTVMIVSVIEKRSPKKSPSDPTVTILNFIEKKKSTVASREDAGSEKSPSKSPFNFADIVGKAKEVEKEKLNVPDNPLEKQDSIEKIPLPEIPFKTTSKPPLPVKSEKPLVLSKEHLIIKEKEPEVVKDEEKSPSPKPTASPKKKSEKSSNLEKPSIPEKTKRILDKIESRFIEISKNSSKKVSRPKIIDTGYDDFVDPVAELPLDDIPVKPAFELDSLKVPDFNSSLLRPHAESLRSKSLSLAEDKASIDTLLSPELESKSFVQDVSPKKIRKAKSEPKKDFKKQSKSLEGEKPPLKKSGSKETNTKINKSKLKLGELPQEIIIIESTDVEPEISIVQKGRSKSVTRLPDRCFSSSNDEDAEKLRTKSASVDDDLIKSLGINITDKQRPKSLGISKSLSNTDKDSLDKVSPKRLSRIKSIDSKVSPNKRSPSRSPATRSPVEAKEIIFIEESAEELELNEAALENKNTKTLKTQKKVTNLANAKKHTEDKILTRQKTINSPVPSRKPSESPTLFTRLGLSEGGGASFLQRQGQATQSPGSQRRAVSLDTPIVALYKLPPANALSNKDDTVEESDDQLPDIIVRHEELDTLQRETSPNFSSETTDATSVPDMFTDSASMTEASTQYLESPVNEFQDITTCPDLIPYEKKDTLIFQEPSDQDNREMALEMALEINVPCKFIDQSSAESSAEPDFMLDNNVIAKWPSSKDLRQLDPTTEDHLSETDSSEHKRKNLKLKSIGPSFSVTIDEAPPDSFMDKEYFPNVTVGMIRERIESIGDYFEHDDHPGMVKSPIQISIEECSDIDESKSDEQNEILQQAIFYAKQVEKPRLDSGDTSEDTLDALDGQEGLQDSEISSPDYIDKMDEKTLVEVVEIRKDEMEGAEELPEDDLPKEDEIDDPNTLSIDRKLRLSTERSRSEETSTYTPDREDPDSSSCSIARPLGIGQVQPINDRREIAMMIESRKQMSMEDESSSTSHQAPKKELSSTWKPFPLESSASSSLEDAGWIPTDEKDDNSDQNNTVRQGDLADFAGALPYAIGPEIMANYGSFALSRTLSRISERSTTSEQDKSDLEDSFKPSSRSPSLDDESLISSDHQPSLSSDPPSGTALPSVSEDRRTSSELPDIPIDIPGDDSKSPRTRRARLQLQSSEDWPSPPSSPLFDTPAMSHVETFYVEVKPKEAIKVTVTDSSETPRAVGDSDSSDENRTLHEDLHSTVFEDCQSSTSATTIDGTVKFAPKPRSNSYITGSSHSEDTSMGLSMSEWSSSNNTVRQYCQYSGGKSDDNSLAELGASISDWSGSTTVIPQQYYTAMTTEKSQSDTTTSEKSITSMRPNSKCQQFEEVNEEVASDYPEEMQEEENHDEFDEARKFVESQFDEHRRRFDDDQTNSVVYTDISPPHITFQSDCDEPIDVDVEFGALPSIPGPILEEEEGDQLYDNVPAMKYTTSEKTRMKVSPGDSSEDMHERYADLALRSRSGDDEWCFQEFRKNMESDKNIKKGFKFDRGYSEPQDPRSGTKSTERPVVVPIRAKSTPYYSTTSLSGESTTSSPPLQIRTQIRTKTMYSACRSPQSEGDTSSSMDSPAHTPDRGQRAFRRKRQQHAKRRQRIYAESELKETYQLVSSTDSSFDVTTIPPPLLPEPSIDIEDEEENNTK